jgi:hypothetical protein
MLFTDVNKTEITKAFTKFFKQERTWVYEDKRTEKVSYQPPTYNKAIGRLSSFSAYVIEIYDLLMFPNIWTKRKVKRKKYNTNPEEFPPELFESVINVINEENGKTVMSGKPRNLYYEWQKEAYIFGLLTGGRRDVVAYATWDSIKFKGDVPSKFKIEKYKENRQNNIELDKHKFYWTQNISPQLKDFLVKKGLYEKIGSSDYIIAPEEQSRENAVKKYSLTDGFSHFSKMATGRVYNFKQLRKTNFTAKVNDYINGLISELDVEHKHISTTKKYYYDKMAG